MLHFSCRYVISSDIGQIPNLLYLLHLIRLNLNMLLLFGATRRLRQILHVVVWIRALVAEVDH